MRFLSMVWLFYNIILLSYNHVGPFTVRLLLQ